MMILNIFKNERKFEVDDENGCLAVALATDIISKYRFAFTECRNNLMMTSMAAPDSKNDAAKDIPMYNFAVKGQGGKIPQVGFGTSGLKGEQCESSVFEALRCGYRLIDTALLYQNHMEVGNAVSRGVKELNLDRDDIFVVSKVAFFPPELKADSADDSTDETEKTAWMYSGGINVKGHEDEAIEKSLSELSMPYVDMFLIHNPTASIQEYSSASLPHFFELFNFKHKDGAVCPKILPNGMDTRPMILESGRNALAANINMDQAYETRKQSWKALEKAKRGGKCRYIGVSNYTRELLLEMKEYAEIMPAVNQLEYHPRFASKELVETAKELGVILIGYGAGNFIQIGASNDPNVTGEAAKKIDKVVNEISERVKKSKHQVVARWMKQQNIVPLLRSASPDHIKDNLQIYDFELSDDDMNLLDKCNEQHPYYWDNVATSMTVRHAVTKIFVNTGKHIARHGQTLAQNLGEKFNRGVAATQTMVAGLGTRSE